MLHLLYLSRYDEIRQTVTYQKQHLYDSHSNGGPFGEKTPLLARQESTEFTQTKTDTSRKPSLYKVLIKTYWKQWMFSTVLKIIDDVFALAQPFLLRYFHHIKIKTLCSVTVLKALHSRYHNIDSYHKIQNPISWFG